MDKVLSQKSTSAKRMKVMMMTTAAVAEEEGVVGVDGVVAGAVAAVQREREAQLEEARPLAEPPRRGELGDEAAALRLLHPISLLRLRRLLQQHQFPRLLRGMTATTVSYLRSTSYPERDIDPMPNRLE